MPGGGMLRIDWAIKYGQHRSPLMLLRKFDLAIHYVQFLCCWITGKVWKNSGFLKSNKGLLCTPNLVCSFFKLLIYIFQRKSDKYIQLVRISWLSINIQTFDFPTILSWLPIMPLQPWSWRVLLHFIHQLSSKTKQQSESIKKSKIKLTSKLVSLKTNWPGGITLASLTTLYEEGLLRLLEFDSTSSATQG